MYIKNIFLSIRLIKKQKILHKKRVFAIFAVSKDKARCRLINFLRIYFAEPRGKWKRIIKERKVLSPMNEDKKLITYCGLYYGDCVNYKGEIADLARDLRKKIRQEKFNRVSKGLSKGASKRKSTSLKPANRFSGT